MASRSFSRRDFIASLGVAAAAGTVLSACGDADQPTQTQAERGATPAQPGAGEGVRASQCPGYADLSEDQRNIRQTLNYQDVSPQAGQYCNNCRFLVENAELSPCIGCQLFQGPVAPEGWCSSWVAIA